MFSIRFVPSLAAMLVLATVSLVRAVDPAAAVTHIITASALMSLKKLLVLEAGVVFR